MDIFGEKWRVLRQKLFH